MAEQNFYDFWTRYSNLCLKCKVCPLKSVIKQMKGTILTVKVERLRCEHWQFLLSALSVDNSLTEICFISDLPSLDEQEELWKKRKRKGETYPIPYGYSAHNISDICKYTNRLLNVSQTLQVLILDHLPITKDDAEFLAEGLKNNKHLEQFGLTCYPYSDDVIEIICRSLWNSRITSLEFNACNLSSESVKKICTVIKKHRDRRMTEAFPDTLRHRSPDYKGLIGLNRIVLNGNNIGNQGARLLFEALSGDFFIKFIELQCCSIDEVGAMFFYKLTESTSLLSIDLRQNQISPNLISSIEEKLKINNNGNILEHTSLWRPQHLSGLIPNRKSKVKPRVLKKYPKVRSAKKERSRLSIRVTNEGDVNLTKIENAAVQTEPYDDEETIKKLQDRLQKVEARLSSEISLRNHLITLAKRIKDENTNLREEVMKLSTYDDVIFIDQETYSEIKRVFEKFQKFLRLMKEYGLWELISAVGIAEYENTKLKAVPSDTKSCTLETDNAPLDARLYKIPNKEAPIPKPQTQSCDCHECTSNPLEKENYTTNVKPAQKFPDQSQIKNMVDKSKVTKVFKEVRDHYMNGESPIHPSLARKFPAGNLRPNDVTDALQCKGFCYAEVARNFHMAKNSKDLYQKIAEAIDRRECFCPLILQNSEKQIGKRISPKKNISGFKNVSSQTINNDMPINYSCHKVNLPTLSGKGSPIAVPKSAHNSSSNPSYKMKSFPPEYLQQAVKIVKSQEWTEHVKKNFPDSNEDLALKTANSSSQSSIVSDKEYFKSKESSDKQSSEQSTISSKGNDYKSEVTYTPSAEANSVPKSKSQSKSRRSLINELSEMIMESNSDKSGLSTSKTSYLETVTDASTDKDVNSLSEIEIFDPEIKQNSASSKNSIISTVKPPKKDASSSTSSLSGTINTKSSKSKSFKKSQKVAGKHLNQTGIGAGVRKNKNASSSSVPSLSDITTVSSHSLNTDSVMGQISGS